MANLKTTNIMKKILLILFLSLSLFSFSQMDRRIGRIPQSTSTKKKEKIDPIQLSLEYLKKELNLDSFQEAATKTYLEENQKEKEYILTLDIIDNDKVEKLKVSYEKMDAQIDALLNKKQREAFIKLKEKRNGKDKKNKKDNKEEELENQ
jgi:hypothetical protein